LNHFSKKVFGEIYFKNIFEKVLKISLASSQAE